MYVGIALGNDSKTNLTIPKQISIPYLFWNRFGKRFQDKYNNSKKISIPYLFWNRFGKRFQDNYYNSKPTKYSVLFFE